MQDAARAFERTAHTLTPDGIHDADRGARAAAPDGQYASPDSSAASQPSWGASLQGLVHELPGLISDRIELLSLELQRAGQVLAQIVALIVAAAIWPLLPVAWRGRMGPDTASILVAVGLPLAGLLFGKRVRAPLPSQRSE